MIEMRIDICPRGKGRPRFGRGHAFTDSKTRAYENRLASEARLLMRGKPAMEGPLSVTVGAFFPIPKSWPKARQQAAIAGTERPVGKPDADNLLKSLDSFNGIFWKDDAQIVQATVMKRYSSAPALVIQIREA